MRNSHFVCKLICLQRHQISYSCGNLAQTRLKLSRMVVSDIDQASYEHDCRGYSSLRDESQARDSVLVNK